MALAFTVEDFNRQYIKEHFRRLTPEEQREALRSLPPKELLGVLPTEQIREYLEQPAAPHPTKPRTSRRKK